LGIFWANPLVGTLMSLSIIMLLVPLVGVLRDYYRKAEARAALSEV
jgi:TctA family transporter